MIDSFVEFDQTIVNRNVVAELKRLAGKPEDDIEDEEEVDNLYQEATMPIEEVIAKYEANEIENTGNQNNESPSNDTSESKPKVLKNPLLTTLASSSGSKGVSPFLRAKTTSIDKNCENNDSLAKEIDFIQEGSPTELVNGTSDKEQLSVQKSVNEESSENKLKNETNGTHAGDNKEASDHSNGEVNNSTIDKSETENINGAPEDDEVNNKLYT